MHKRLKLVFLLGFGIWGLWFASPKAVFAQSLHSGCGSGLADSLNYINSAIGCIPISSSDAFASFILKWILGIGSGVAFILLIYSAILIITSSGDPKRLQAGQEMLGATISGLLFMIFSVFILRIVGVNILGLFK